MVPIYESDLAEERAQKEEWKNYELWEKIEIRLRRTRRIWITSTVILFFTLSSVPVVMDRLPYWTARKAAVEISKKLVELKREAQVRRKSIRVKFLPEIGLSMEFLEAENCESNISQTISQWQPNLRSRDEFKFVSASEDTDAARFQLTREICFDPVKGLWMAGATEKKQAIAISFVKDLTENHRFDRMAVVILQGESAEISFN